MLFLYVQSCSLDFLLRFSCFSPPCLTGLHYISTLCEKKNWLSYLNSQKIVLVLFIIFFLSHNTLLFFMMILFTVSLRCHSITYISFLFFLPLGFRAYFYVGGFPQISGYPCSKDFIWPWGLFCIYKSLLRTNILFFKI